MDAHYARVHALLNTVISLVGSLHGIALNSLINVGLHVEELDAGQPALAYYVGDRARLLPAETAPINLAVTPPPNLIVELARGSMVYEMGEQRQLYEELGVDEYWIVDSQTLLVVAYAIAQGQSQGLQQSTLLPGLRVDLIYEILQQQRHLSDAQIILWLLSEVLPRP